MDEQMEVTQAGEGGGTAAAEQPPQRKPNRLLEGLKWVFVGPEGVRSGWSVAMVVGIAWGIGRLLMMLAAMVVKATHAHQQERSFTAGNALIGELIFFAIIFVSVALASLIERRRLFRFYLIGPNRLRNFAVGIAGGFASLSVLMGGLYAGHLLQFNGVALGGMEIWKYAGLWGAAFFMVGMVEEGMFRMYLQHTLTRGLNFWWAFGTLALVCTLLIVGGKGNGVWGVYVIALLGLVPCFLAHQKKLASSGFWQAAWVTSTLFGAIHTNNGGENWVGIFSAAAIGFVFCVSIYLTGTVWWAVGFHAAWDWGLTYFYGAADSGNPAKGHLLSTTPMGNPLWSGGADGPEGSLLIVPLLVLILAVLVFAYRKRQGAAETTAAELPAG